jgi:hypothetical protein
MERCVSYGSLSAIVSYRCTTRTQILSLPALLVQKQNTITDAASGLLSDSCTPGSSCGGNVVHLPALAICVCVSTCVCVSGKKRDRNEGRQKRERREEVATMCAFARAFCVSDYARVLARKCCVVYNEGYQAVNSWNR